MGSVLLLCFFSTFTLGVLSDPQIRLVPGNYNNGPGGVRGRVEVLHNGEWGSICNLKWTWKEQNVACQQLGYIQAIHVHNYKYNDGKAPRVWLNSVTCTGNEESLLDCNHEAWGVLKSRGCRPPRRRDAGVWCLTKVIRPVIPVGCYIDFDKKRALTDLYASLRKEINWYDLGSMVAKCAEGAVAKNYRYFGVQYFGECWGDKGGNPPFIANKYPKNNMTQCPGGVGDQIHNMVYELAPWESVGCWKDRKNSRTMTLLKNMRGNIDWFNLLKLVKRCYDLAKASKYEYFSIQFYGECWAGNGEGYKVHGESGNCWNGIGQAWSNSVYKVLW